MVRLLFAACAAMSAVTGAVTPVQKVISMLNEIRVKGQGELEAEAHQFDEYSKWVTEQMRSTAFSIEDNETAIEKLSAQMNKADSDAAGLGAAIKELDADVATWEADHSRAKDVRRQESEDNRAMHQDLSESLDALERAIRTLSAQAFDRKQADSLLQTMATSSTGMRSVLARLSEMGYEEPAADASEFQSGGILEMLKKLKRKFRDELHDLETAEANSRHAFELLSMSLQDQISVSSSDLNAKAVRKASREKQSAEWAGQLADSRASLKADKKYMTDVRSTFSTKKADFMRNQATRKAELEAVAKATDIISSESVKGAAAEHLPQLAQTSFTQLRSKVATARSQVAAVEVLRAAAAKTGSQQLAMLAARAGADPFAKVIKMVKDLIARLEDEAVAEADHKAWCDKELKDNKVTRNKKLAEVDVLRANLAELSAVIAKLGDEIATLESEQAAMNKAMSEASAIRTEEQSANKHAISDAREGQAAVAQALEVLREFYAKAGQDVALVQSGAQQVPELANYEGNQSANKGVIGMLEVIQSDFARLEAETSASESQASTEYSTFMADFKADTAAKHKESFDKSLLKDQKEHEQHLTRKDLKSSVAELDAANKYHDELKPQCVTVHVSYEERVKLRQEEIAALEEAYEVLGGSM